ncbi:MAG: hypothetical protein AAGA87_05970 [Pseudomonadota bacterium]
MLRWEYLGVFLIALMIVANFFVGRSAIRIWRRMLTAFHRASNGTASKDETRFILEPEMKKETKVGLLWLLVLIVVMLVLAFFREDG